MTAIFFVFIFSLCRGDAEQANQICLMLWKIKLNDGVGLISSLEL
jgi:hypothetical protein